MTLTPAEIELICRCLDAKDMHEARHLAEQLPAEREYGYSYGGCLGQVFWFEETLMPLLPEPYRSMKARPSSDFPRDETPPPVNRLPPSPQARPATRPQQGVQARSTTRPLRFEEYPAEVRKAFLASAQPAPEPEPEAPPWPPPGFVEIEGRLYPLEAFRA